MDRGQSWRRHCWRKARADLLPKTMPIEVIRGRVRRAAELGLSYRTYAGIRASTGHDVVAILFSTNALGLFKGRALPEGRQKKLVALERCARVALTIRPMTISDTLEAAPVLSAVYDAPPAFAAWSVQRAAIRVACQSIPSDQVLLVGDTHMESEWAQSGRLAGYLSGDRYFAP